MKTLQQKRIQPDLFLAKINAPSKSILFKELAEQAHAIVRYPTSLIEKKLSAKNNLDATTIGQGIALPNIRLDGISNRTVILATLERPLSLKTPDDRSVDIICFLVSPERESTIHLRTLSRLSRMFRDKEFINQIRDANDSDTLKALFIDHKGWLLAAA